MNDITVNGLLGCTLKGGLYDRIRHTGNHVLVIILAYLASKSFKNTTLVLYGGSF